MTRLKQLPEFINGFKVIKDLKMIESKGTSKRDRKCIVECPKCKNHFTSRPSRLKKQQTCSCINKLPNDISILYKLRKAYRSMLDRCDPKYNKKYYADKGITVCNEWKDNIVLFCRWSIDNNYIEGQRMTLDRIDSDKGYSPNNCRWTDWKTQNRNKKDIKLEEKKVIFIRNNYPKFSQKQLAEKFGVNQSTISRVIHNKRWAL